MIAFVATLALLGSESSPMAPAVKGSIPQLVTSGGDTRLWVDRKPFLILGGELFNSSSSSIENMEKLWPHLANLHVNTVLTPITWEQIEPKEGTYDFSLIDGLLKGARAHNLHLVFLWLASWKNGMSSYDPLWVKQDYHRFPLARNADGSPMRVLSTLGEATWQADATAFAHVMRHLKNVDRRDHTVLMMQVENEVGILGDSRDRSPEANAAFNGPIPAGLAQRLKPGGLLPELNDRWVAQGSKTSGSWVQVFGTGPRTDELFMAWNYARYVDHVAAAGKAEYPIPMYANAWLNDPMTAKPGDYPSGCPEAQVMDIWKAAAPHLDLLGPDLYAANFRERCELYTRDHNPLFIPEMGSDEGGAHNVFLAIGEFGAIGTSPFGIDRVKEESPFSKSYAMLQEIAPMLQVGTEPRPHHGFVVTPEHPRVTFDLGGNEVEVTLDSMFGRTVSQAGYGVIIATGPGEYLGTGAGFQVRFRPLTPGPSHVGLGTVEEGHLVDDKWIPGRQLNGDETNQGGEWRFPVYAPGLKRCTTYRFE